MPLLVTGAAVLTQLPPLAIDLTGCWAMGASNGRKVQPGCGTAPLDGADGLMYLSQQPGGGNVDACLSQGCYRPAKGLLSNTSSGAGILQLQTLTGKGNCSSATHPSFPADGLLEYFNFIIPRGWPSNGSQTRGTNVRATDLSGVFVNDDNPAGTAGGIFLTRHVNPAACDRMRALPDCSAVPPQSTLKSSGTTESAAAPDHSSRETTTLACAVALRAACQAEQSMGRVCMRCLEVPAYHARIRTAGCRPPDVQRFCRTGPAPAPSPSPIPPLDVRNMTGCYAFGGSAGRTPAVGCGMSTPNTNGHAYIVHSANGTIQVCLHQFCTRVLQGRFHTASNGVGYMLTETVFDRGNCTSKHSPHFPKDGLYAHIDFLVPAGWPNTTAKTRGVATDGPHTLAGVFVNNGPALAGVLKMDPDVEPRQCEDMRQLRYCADFMPPPGR